MKTENVDSILSKHYAYSYSCSVPITTGLNVLMYTYLTVNLTAGLWRWHFGCDQWHGGSHDDLWLWWSSLWSWPHCWWVGIQWHKNTNLNLVYTIIIYTKLSVDALSLFSLFPKDYTYRVVAQIFACLADITGSSSLRLCPLGPMNQGLASRLLLLSLPPMSGSRMGIFFRALGEVPISGGNLYAPNNLIW